MPASLPATVAPRWQVDFEPERPGHCEPALTLFLVGMRCRFRCVYCDLAAGMLEEPTPPGALPAQIRDGLAAAPPCPTVKLYNASNYFDNRAVPPADDAAIAALVRRHRRIVVECHPRLVGVRMERFAARLEGTLEVAMGLETVHPQALPRLDKAMTLADYDRAAARILAAGGSHRAFVLIGTPFVPPAEQLEWVLRSTQHAAAQGARLISLIPLRPRAVAGVPMQAPSLREVEQVLETALQAKLDSAIQVDPWDLAHLVACPHCAVARMARITAMNRSGRLEPVVDCTHCETPT